MQFHRFKGRVFVFVTTILSVLETEQVEVWESQVVRFVTDFVCQQESTNVFDMFAIEGFLLDR
jgi:hypothetical protein